MNIHRYLFLPVFLFCTASLVSQPSPWRDAAVSIDGPEGEGRHALRGYRSLEIDASLLETVFSNRLTDTFELLLPLPEGGFSRFRLWPSAVMPPGLAARFPRVRAFAGAGAGGARLRLERTPRGLRAMVLQTGRDYFIEPSTGG